MTSPARRIVLIFALQTFTFYGRAGGPLILRTSMVGPKDILQTSAIEFCSRPNPFSRFNLCFFSDFSSLQGVTLPVWETHVKSMGGQWLGM